MSTNHLSGSEEGRSLPIAFPLNPSPNMSFEELAERLGKDVFLKILRANVSYLKVCADAQKTLYANIDAILEDTMGGGSPSSKQ